jgi:ferritin-like metal-binding protein YciE
MPELKLNERDTKLVQWLNEAHAKEAELEADLTAHIALTQKQSYKKRLRQHLTETKAHKRSVASRIKQLGGSAVAGPSLPGVPDAIGEVAGKAVSAVKTQVGTARAAVNDETETQLRNAQEELREEHVEIALYSRIIVFAEAVGDRETAQLAKAIRRDEERMAKFLDAELGRLVKELVRKQVPRAQRTTAGNRRRSRRTTGSRRSSTSAKSAGTTRTARTTPTASGSSRSSGRSRTGTSRSTGRARSGRARSSSGTRARARS